MGAEFPGVRILVNGIQTDLEGNAIAGDRKKARKGSFVISVNNNCDDSSVTTTSSDGSDSDSSSGVVVELLDLVRPFPALKALDMEQVCHDVVEAIRVMKDEQE